MSVKQGAVMEATLKKWGNSQGILIPKNLCEYLGVSIGDHLEVEESDGAITMRPIQKRFARSKRVSASELFSDWNGSYEAPADWDLKGAEIDWGKPTGEELSW
mgnify:CR=1 FL=1